MTLQQVQERHPAPRWRCYRTKPSGHCWAASAHRDHPGDSGVTLDADTPDALDAAISEHEERFHGEGVWAA